MRTEFSRDRGDYCFILKPSPIRRSTILVYFFEDLDVRDADIEGILSPDQSVWSHSPLIRAAYSPVFERSHSALQRLPED